MHHLSRLLLSLLLLFSAVPALAQGAGWTISEIKGRVVVIDSRGERPASAGQALVPGATVRTQARASAVLVRGREFVTLRQNAQVRIPEAARSRSIVQIIQDYGSALFNIGKQADPPFGVETPYLAAVVKGTTFIIAVGEDGATLQVTEGAVEAATPDGGARELVLPGAVAMVAANDTMRLVIEGEGRRVIDSPARPAGGPAAAAPAPGAAPIRGAGPAAERTGRRIAEPIAGTPGDLRGFTGGFVSGEVAVIAATVVADNTARRSDPPFSGGGNGNGNGGGNGAGQDQGNGGGAGDGNGGDQGNGAGNGQGGNGGNGGDGAGNGNGGNGSGQGNGQDGNGNAGNGNGGNGQGNGSDGNGGGQGNGNGNGNGNGGGNNGSGGNGNGDAGDDGNGGGDDDGDDDRGNGGNGNAGGNAGGNGNGSGGGSGRGDPDDGDDGSDDGDDGSDDGDDGSDDSNGRGGKGDDGADGQRGMDAGPALRQRIGGANVVGDGPAAPQNRADVPAGRLIDRAYGAAGRDLPRAMADRAAPFADPL